MLCFIFVSVARDSSSKVRNLRKTDNTSVTILQVSVVKCHFSLPFTVCLKLLL